MPFEPLRTDEKLKQPVRRERDMDTHMLVGCSGFVFTAVAAYVISVWPFLVFSDSEKMSSLLLAALLGPAPAALLGVLACRRFRHSRRDRLCRGQPGFGVRGSLLSSRLPRTWPKPRSRVQMGVSIIFNKLLPIARFRFNRRTSRARTHLFRRLMEGVVMHDHTTCSAL
jgi:hypothetical protein